MNTTNELLQQLNTMQTNHIKVMEERIEVISQHRQHLNETISNQAKQLEEQLKRIDILKHTIEIDNITIKTQEKTIEIYFNNLNTKSNV
tara:strand:- start:45 stop:311 length:267 start_codon:yes stop_codon:yes gene_type:complete